MRKFLCKLFNLITNEQYVADCARLAEQADISRAYGHDIGFEKGLKQAKVHFAVLPLPFTESQLLGREYGDFITPAGFATVLGECSVPAPGPHGYEQRAYYIGKTALEKGDGDLWCHNPVKFNPVNPDEDGVVPVIVTVLR